MLSDIRGGGGRGRVNDLIFSGGGGVGFCASSFARHNFECFESSIPFSVLPLYNLLPGSLSELRQICRQAPIKDLGVVRFKIT